MKVCINALAATLGGGATYITNILPLLGGSGGQRHRFLVLVNKGTEFSRPLPANVCLVPVAIPFDAVALRLLYEQAVLPLMLLRWKVDLLYSPQDSTTLGAPCKVVLALRNSNLYTETALYGKGERLRIAILKGLARVSARRADRLLYVSEDSRRWISAAIGQPLEKSVAVHHGIAPRRDGDGAAVDVGGGRPYILSVSTIYEYKNFVRLIEAFGLAVDGGLDGDLVIIGKNMDPPYFERMRQAAEIPALAGRVHLLGHVEYERVFGYYRGARLFVLPSYLESFGHPLLEAMAVGTPVAASDLPVFREVAADAAVYFDPYDPEDMAKAMQAAYDSDARRAELARAGVARAAGFSWERTVEKTVAVFESVAEGG